jgi:hypothetical protein
MPYDDDDLRNSIFRQTTNDSQRQAQLKSAAKNRQMEVIEDCVFKVTAKIIGQSVPFIKRTPWLRTIVEDVTPTVFRWVWNSWFGGR